MTLEDIDSESIQMMSAAELTAAVVLLADAISELQPEEVVSQGDAGSSDPLFRGSERFGRLQELRRLRDEVLNKRKGIR